MTATLQLRQLKKYAPDLYGQAIDGLKYGSKSPVATAMKQLLQRLSPMSSERLLEVATSRIESQDLPKSDGFQAKIADFNGTDVSLCEEHGLLYLYDIKRGKSKPVAFKSEVVGWQMTNYAGKAFEAWLQPKPYQPGRYDRGASGASRVRW